MTFTIGQIVAFIVGLLGLVLTVLNIVDKRNAMQKQAEQPFNDLKKRVDGHDVEIGDIKQALKLGNDRFREQEETAATFKSVMLSFVNFEIAYCLHTGYEHTEDLMEAKRELESYLAGKKHREE